MNQSIHGGPLSVVNNSNIGDAYRTQIFNQPSLAEIAQQQRRSDLNGDDCNEFMDDDSFTGFDAMGEDSDDQNHNEDDNTSLPLKYRNKMKRYETNKYKAPDENLSAPENFTYTDGNVMGSQATAYAELLKICQKHHADKSLFDDIQTWATFWAESDINVFREQTCANRWSRKKLMKFLKKVFPFEGMEPKSIIVELHDGRKVTVPQVDFAESMRSILNDKEVMKHIMKGLDPNTWRPMTSEETHENDDDAVIDDKDSGWLYRQGIKLHCPDETECDSTKVRPFPLLIHIDYIW
jgi:hypothetical protein